MNSEDYNFTHFFGNVEGWINKNVAIDILDAIDAFQKKSNVHGAVMEIGVHHGKFFIPIHNKIRGAECSYAVDLFDMQALNIDRSGRGDKHVFCSNMQKYAKMPEKCIVVQSDSTTWDYSEVVNNQQQINQRLRIISIDGSHTMNATVIDLIECEKRLVSGGVIFVDDYNNVHWPGVACGVSKFYLQTSPRIAPFFLGLNKLILCHTTWHKKYFELMDLLTKKNTTRKSVDMHGHHLISVREWL